MSVVFSQHVGDELVTKLSAGVSTEAYQELCAIRYGHRFVEQLNKLSPFSLEYKNLAMTIYNDLRGNIVRAYDPETDETSGIEEEENLPKWWPISWIRTWRMMWPSDIHKKASPWNFNDPKLIAEFLFSWGQIFKHLDVMPGQSVLEYGSGSGQTLLMLARAGIECFGVDIDPSSLSLLQRQAHDLGVTVSTELAQFGEGFDSKRFDRILFFEAFHHAREFEGLLIGLHARMKPGGKIVFCGEPIVKGSDSSIPYPWGPRLDALSVYCTRARGWMELGFQHDTFVELLWRCGWKVKFYPFASCARANVYVAEPVWSGIPMSDDIELGRCVEGWHPPESAHRWTKSKAQIHLPIAATTSVDVELNLSNYLETSKTVRLSSGSALTEITMPPGESNRWVLLNRCDGSELTLECATNSTATDLRQLGVAVHRLSFHKP